MPCRIVMPREVPDGRVSRLMWRMWRNGYSSRPTMRAGARPGWVVLEFWIEAEDVADDGLVAFEIELDDILRRVMRLEFFERVSRVER